MSVTTLFGIVLSTWLVVGVATGVVMGRRGHAAFAWTLFGVVLGPLVLPLAAVAIQRVATRPRPRWSPSAPQGLDLSTFWSELMGPRKPTPQPGPLSPWPLIGWGGAPWHGYLTSKRPRPAWCGVNASVPPPS